MRAFYPRDLFQEIRRVFFDNEDVKARDLLRKLIQSTQTLSKVRYLLLTHSTLLLCLGKAIHVDFEMVTVLVLQEVVTRLYRILCVMAWQSSLEQE